jgi:hypothetical protein
VRWGLMINKVGVVDIRQQSYVVASEYDVLLRAGVIRRMCGCGLTRHSQWMFTC